MTWSTTGGSKIVPQDGQKGHVDIVHNIGGRIVFIVSNDKKGVDECLDKDNLEYTATIQCSMFLKKIKKNNNSA